MSNGRTHVPSPFTAKENIHSMMPKRVHSCQSNRMCREKQNKQIETFAVSVKLSIGCRQLKLTSQLHNGRPRISSSTEEAVNR